MVQLSPELSVEDRYTTTEQNPSTNKRPDVTESSGKFKIEILQLLIMNLQVQIMILLMLFDLV